MGSTRIVVSILPCLSCVSRFLVSFRVFVADPKLSPRVRLVPLDRLNSRHRSLLERSVLRHHRSQVLCLDFLEGCSCFGKLSMAPSGSRLTWFAEVGSNLQNADTIQYVGEVLRFLLAVPPSPLDKKHNVK